MAGSKCLWNRLARMRLAKRSSVRIIVPVLLAGTYRHYRGTTTALPLYRGTTICTRIMLLAQDTGCIRR